MYASNLHKHGIDSDPIFFFATCIFRGGNVHEKIRCSMFINSAVALTCSKLEACNCYVSCIYVAFDQEKN